MNRLRLLNTAILLTLVIFTTAVLAADSATYTDTTRIYVPGRTGNKWVDTAPAGSEYYAVQQGGTVFFATHVNAQGTTVDTRTAIGTTPTDPSAWSAIGPPSATFTPPRPAGPVPAGSGTRSTPTGTTSTIQVQAVNGQFIGTSTDAQGRPTMIVGGTYNPSNQQFTGGNTITLPRGTSVDFSTYDPSPANQRNIPLSGGGRVVLAPTTDQNYVVFDANNRPTSQTSGPLTRTWTYASNTPPVAGQATSSDYRRITTTTLEVTGVNGRLEVPVDDRGNLRVPAGVSTDSQLDVFTRAALSAGINKVDPAGLDGRTLTQSGQTIIFTDNNNIALLQGTPGGSSDRYQLFFTHDTPNDYTGGPDFKAGSSVEITGDNVGRATDARGGLDVSRLPDGSFQLTERQAPDAQGNRPIHVVSFTQNAGTSTTTSDSTINPTTGEYAYKFTREDGTFQQGTGRVGANHIAIQTSGLPAEIRDSFTPAAIQGQISRQFGPNAQVIQPDPSKNIILVNGQWFGVDAGTGAMLPCTGAIRTADCSGISSEDRDRFENDVDRQNKANGIPSTNALTFGQALKDFVYYANAYPGFAGYSSILFPESFLQSWRDSVNTIFCDMLHIGGTECWTSQICEVYTDSDPPSGTLVGQQPDGSPRSIAHIEGERSPPFDFKTTDRKQLVNIFGNTVISVAGKRYNLSNKSADYSQLPPITARIYKVTLSFVAEQDSTINVEFVSSNRTVQWFSPGQVVTGGSTYSRIRSNPIVFTSANQYDQVCLTFNPSQPTLSGNNVDRFCAPLSEYQGAAQPPAPTPSGSQQPASGAGSPSTPIEGGGI